MKYSKASLPEQEIQKLLKYLLPGTIFDGKVFSVGGYERDLMMGKESKDLDLVVEIKGGSEQLAKFISKMFPDQTSTPRQLGSGYPIWHISFKDDVSYEGVQFKTKDGEIDIADTQKETYPDPNSRQRATEFATLEEDVQRRDFTVNMLLRDLSSGEIKDLTGVSQNDIENGILRGHPQVVPDKMFSEDPLRMMRLIRFQVKYGWEIPLSMIKAVRRNADQIQKISWERIQEELVKIMKLGRMAQAVQLMKASGLLEYILPEIQGLIGVQHDKRYHNEGDVYKHTLAVLSNAEPTVVAQLSALLHDIGKPQTQEFIGNNIQFLGHEKVGGEIAEAILRRLKFDNNTIKAVRKMVEFHMRPLNLSEATPKALRKFIREVGADVIDGVLDLARADSLGTLPPIDYVPELREKIKFIQNYAPEKNKPLLDGKEIMTLLNIKPGPKVKEVLTFLKDLEDEYFENRTELTKEIAQQKILEKFASNFHLSKRARFGDDWFKPSMTWTKPSFESESGEFLRVAQEEGISYDSLKRSFAHGYLKSLNRREWELLDNTDSYNISSIDEAIQYSEEYARDWKRIKQAFDIGGSLPAPIVLEFNDGKITLVAGNTRLMFAKALHVKPVVFWIKETQLFKSPETLDVE